MPECVYCKAILPEAAMVYLGQDKWRCRVHKAVDALQHGRYFDHGTLDERYRAYRDKYKLDRR